MYMMTLYFYLVEDGGQRPFDDGFYPVRAYDQACFLLIIDGDVIFG